MPRLLAVEPTAGRCMRLTVSLEKAPRNGVEQIGVSIHTRCNRCGEGLSFSLFLMTGRLNEHGVIQLKCCSLRQLMASILSNADLGVKDASSLGHDSVLWFQTSKKEDRCRPDSAPDA